MTRKEEDEFFLFFKKAKSKKNAFTRWLAVNHTQNAMSTKNVQVVST